MTPENLHKINILQCSQARYSIWKSFSSQIPAFLHPRQNIGGSYVIKVHDSDLWLWPSSPTSVSPPPPPPFENSWLSHITMIIFLWTTFSWPFTLALGPYSPKALKIYPCTLGSSLSKASTCHMTVTATYDDLIWLFFFIGVGFFWMRMIFLFLNG